MRDWLKLLLGGKHQGRIILQSSKMAISRQYVSCRQNLHFDKRPTANLILLCSFLRRVHCSLIQLPPIEGHYPGSNLSNQ